jgi:predicted transcriptional regulator
MDSVKRSILMKMAAAHVPDHVLTALDQIAEKQGVARTVVIRRALDAYIKRFSLPISPVQRTNGQDKEHPADVPA